MFKQTRFLLTGVHPAGAPHRETRNHQCQLRLRSQLFIQRLRWATARPPPALSTSAICSEDGDAYDISGNYSASYSTADGSAISINPLVTYIGTMPSVATDTLDFSMFQSYFDTSCCTWAGLYSESIPLYLSNLAGPGSSISGELFYDGQGVGLVGPYGPGVYSETRSANLDFGNLNTSPFLAAEYDFSFVFGAGTLPGADASAATPEPELAIPCGLVLILASYLLRRQDRSSTSRQSSACLSTLQRKEVR